MTREQIQSLRSDQLMSLIATTNPTGFYHQEVKWAKEEMDRRGIDYQHCLSEEN